MRKEWVRGGEVGLGGRRPNVLLASFQACTGKCGVRGTGRGQLKPTAPMYCAHPRQWGRRDPAQALPDLHRQGESCKGCIPLQGVVPLQHTLRCEGVCRLGRVAQTNQDLQMCRAFRVSCAAQGVLPRPRPRRVHCVQGRSCATGGLLTYCNHMGQSTTLYCCAAAQPHHTLLPTALNPS